MESVGMMFDLNFYRGKAVFVTGHTGFKGSWLCRLLLGLGANVTGYSLSAPTNPNLYSMADIDSNINSVIGDIRNFSYLKEAFDKAQPEIVFHLAAQPIVRESYKNPHYTYETNVMGTVNILECVRQTNCVRSFLNVTTDKVYENKEWVWGYREDEPLDGFDPYSNSKSCSELITHSYNSSFFLERGIPISTARAGNVIGGGDFAENRIIPDCVRAQLTGETILVRNPYSIRPYQHVLEPIVAYLLIAQRQFEESALAGWYNVGPDDCDCVTTGELVNLFCSKWKAHACWKRQDDPRSPHEATFLKLDCSKIKARLGWKPHWHIDEAIEKTCEWSKVWMDNGDIASVMDKQIREYLDI